MGLAVAGAAALLARPWLAAAADHPTAALVVLFVALGAVGAWWPVPGAASPGAVARVAPWATTAAVAAVGLAAFGAVTLASAGLLVGRRRPEGHGGKEERRQGPHAPSQVTIAVVHR